MQTGSEAHPASYPPGTRDAFPGVKRLESEFDYLTPSNAEVRIPGAVPPILRTT